MNHKPLKSIWVFEKGRFVARRWVLADEQDLANQDSVSAPPLAAISSTEDCDSVNVGLSEELSKNKA